MLQHNKAKYYFLVSNKDKASLKKLAFLFVESALMEALEVKGTDGFDDTVGVSAVELRFELSRI
jgi:hypothetical protein